MDRRKTDFLNSRSLRMAALVAGVLVAGNYAAFAQSTLPPTEPPPWQPSVDGLDSPQPYFDTELSKITPPMNVAPTATETLSPIHPNDFPLDTIEPLPSQYTEPRSASDVFPSQGTPVFNMGQLQQTEPLQRFGYTTPVRANFYSGETYAEPAPFLSLEILRPVLNSRFNNGDEVLTYLDGRFGVSTAGGGVLTNLGVGQRAYIDSWDSIFDVNFWYDVDGTRDRLFQQVAAGAQMQSQNLLVRGHYYLPVGDTEKVIGYSALTGNYSFEGNNLALERYREDDAAFKGYDVEAGLIVPTFGQTARWFVGYYNFEAENAETIAGYSSTIVFDPIPNLTVGLQITFDEETHDTGYLFSATYDFYSGPRDPAPNIRHRLGESVRRNHHIVSRRDNVYDPELATNANGDLYNFIHVSSVGNSNGTLKSPYANLSEAATDASATPNSIIIAHADSVFDGQSIVLPANTRFLGEGVEHNLVTADSQLGTIILPAATTGTTLPIIRNSPATGPAISLASGTEVNGFRIESANAAAIYGTGATDGTSILNTTVEGAEVGLHLFQAEGPYSITGLSVNNSTRSGIWLEDSRATAAVTFTDAVTVNNAGEHGIYLQQNEDGSVATFEGAVNVANTGAHGIFLDNNGDNTTTTFNGPVTVNSTGGTGVVVSNVGTTTLTAGTDVTFASTLTIGGTGASGLLADANNSNVSITTLAISDWQSSAIAVSGGDGAISVANPIVLNNVNGSLAPTLQVANFSGPVTFNDVTVTDTARVAIGLPTVMLSQNQTGINDITFNTLNVTANNGIGLFAQDSGATVSKLVIGGGSITTAGSTAVSLESVASDISLQSVSTSNTAVGISLRNVGQANAFHEKFQIVGDNDVAGSGGVLTNVQFGVLVDGSEDVSLNFMNIDSSVAGVRSQSNGTNQPENLTVNRVVLTDGGSSADWIGIDVAWGNGAHFGDANTFSSNVITGSGSNQTGIRINNDQSLPELQATIGGNTIDLTGATSNGISLTARGLLVGQTSNSGGINLSTSLDNIINATSSPFVSTASNGASITGQILVNGTLSP